METSDQSNKLPERKVLVGRFSTAAGRWSGVGPYYAMFPAKFADQVVESYTDAGDVIYDPFSGRGTALFSAAVKQRLAIGVEISPVGWVYSKAKLDAAPKAAVLSRLAEIEEKSPEFLHEAKTYPVFFRYAYSSKVLAFLLAARHMLKWRSKQPDWTLMALLLIELHGKRGESLSNQMRQTKAMWPEYSVRWWEEQKMVAPPEIEVRDFMRKKIDWRYAKGVPVISEGSHVALGDNTKIFDKAFSGVDKPIKLLFTSPPYPGVTNYHIDQWIRLWLLGGETRPIGRGQGFHKGRFGDIKKYEKLLRKSFGHALERLHANATIYIRTEKRPSTRALTLSILKDLFPRKVVAEVEHDSATYNTQTVLFGDSSPKQGEVDIILTPKRKIKNPSTELRSQHNMA